MLMLPTAGPELGELHVNFERQGGKLVLDLEAFDVHGDHAEEGAALSIEAARTLHDWLGAQLRWVAEQGGEGRCLDCGCVFPADSDAPVPDCPDCRPEAQP